MKHEKIYTDTFKENMEWIIEKRLHEENIITEINHYMNNIMIPNWEDKEDDTEYIETIYEFNSLLIKIKRLQSLKGKTRLDKTTPYIDQLNKIHRLTRRITKLEKELIESFHKLLT